MLLSNFRICASAVTKHLLVKDNQANGLIAGNADRLLANHELRSILTIEPCIGADLPGSAVFGTAAELHTEGKALSVKIFARIPVARNARCAREPFPSTRGVAYDKTWKLVQIDKTDSRRG